MSTRPIELMRGPIKLMRGPIELMRGPLKLIACHRGDVSEVFIQ
jgi:hypothetical protein